MMAKTGSIVSKPEVWCQHGSYSDQLLRRQCAAIGTLASRRVSYTIDKLLFFPVYRIMWLHHI